MSTIFHSSQGTYTNSKARYAHYPSAASDDKLIRKTSCSVIVVGIILVVISVLFILKWSEAGVFLSVGLVRSGLYSTDESRRDNPLQIIWLALLIISPALYFILA